MNDCETLREDLKAYRDGELPLLPRLAVRRHLARCASCREEVRTMEQIGNDLRAGDAGDLAPALRAKILSGASGAEPEPAVDPAKPDARPVSPPFWQRRPLAVWGAVATVLLAWFIAYPLTRPAREKARMGATSRQIGSAHRMYSQGYDEAHRSGSDPNVTSSARPAVVAAPEPAARKTAPQIESFVENGKVFKQRELDGSGPARTFFSSAIPARRVHREAEITVAVDTIEPKSEAVEQIVRGAGGFVASNQLSTGGNNTKSASLTVRVPVAQFEATLRQIAKLGEVRAKNVTGEDITEQTSDAEQENHVLANEIRYKEARLRSRGARANSLSEEQAARNLRIELAQARARLELLKKMAALAAITVQLEEKARTKVQGGGFLEEMSDTSRAAITSFVQAARLPVLLLIWIVAYAPLWVPLALAYRCAARAQQRRARAGQARWKPAPEGEGAPG